MENENETIENQEMSKKERADIKRAEKTKVEQQARAARKIKKYVSISGVFVVIIGLLFWGVTAAQKAEESRPGDHHASEGRTHIALGDEHDEYQTNPPTSGSHADPIRFDSYDTEIADENAIHNMEHGGIWISYKDLTSEELIQLEAIQRKAPNAVLLSPRSGNDSRISVASWQRLMHLEEVDIAVIEEYITRNINKSPEPLAR